MAAAGGGNDDEGHQNSDPNGGFSDLLKACASDEVSSDNVEDGSDVAVPDVSAGDENGSGDDDPGNSDKRTTVQVRDGDDPGNSDKGNTAQVKDADDPGNSDKGNTVQNPRQLIQNAVNILTHGSQKERHNAILEAVSLYKHGIELLLKASKVPSVSQKIRGVLRSKIEVYLSKAEHLQNHVIKKTRSESCAFCVPDYQPDETRRMNEFFSAFVVRKNDKRSLDEVIGNTESKDRLKECLVLPLRFPRLFTGSRRPNQTMLLFGHPGTGKTMLLSAIAAECPGCTFIRLSVYDLFSRNHGDAEGNVKKLFQFVRERVPCCLCIEDIQVIDEQTNEEARVQWHRMGTELLVQMEGIWRSSDTRNVFIVFITQRPWCTGSSLRRRTALRIFVDLPGRIDRINIIKSNMKNVRHNLTNDNFSQLGDRTMSLGGYRCTQADLFVLCRDATMQNIRRIQQAKYFKQVVDPDTNKEGLWTPCCKDDEGSVEMTWEQLEGKQLLEPHVEMSDFLKSMETCQGTVSPHSEHQMQQWVDDFVRY